MYNEIKVTFPLRNNFCPSGEDVFLSEAFPSVQSEPLASAVGLSRGLAGAGTSVPLSPGRAFILAPHAPPLQGGAVFYHTRAGTFPMSLSRALPRLRGQTSFLVNLRQPQPASALQSAAARSLLLKRRGVWHQQS